MSIVLKSIAQCAAIAIAIGAATWIRTEIKSDKKAKNVAFEYKLLSFHAITFNGDGEPSEGLTTLEAEGWKLAAILEGIPDPEKSVQIVDGKRSINFLQLPRYYFKRPVVAAR